MELKRFCEDMSGALKCLEGLLSRHFKAPKWLDLHVLPPNLSLIFTRK